MTQMDIQALWDELEASLTPLLLGFRSRLGRIAVSQKPDLTLLTEADIAVQEYIVELILAHDPDASFVAEEAGDQLRFTVNSQKLWIIDPIDGTAEFVRPDRREYCSVICLLENRAPVAALVVAPQAGKDGSALTIRVDGPGSPIKVNGRASASRSVAAPLRASITRSSSDAARPWERLMSAAGYELKTRTTSQTLDMVRTCVDLSEEADAALAPFALFYREAQKVWDGAAGMCLARTAGLRVCDGQGQDRHTVDLDLSAAEPAFASTLVGDPAVAAQFLRWSSN